MIELGRSFIVAGLLALVCVTPALVDAASCLLGRSMEVCHPDVICGGEKFPVLGHE